MAIPYDPPKPYFLFQVLGDGKMVFDFFRPVQAPKPNHTAMPEVSVEIFRGKVQVWGARYVTPAEDNRRTEAIYLKTISHRPDFRKRSSEQGRATFYCEMNHEGNKFVVSCGSVTVTVQPEGRRVVVWDYHTLTIHQGGFSHVLSRDVPLKPVLHPRHSQLRLVKNER